VDSEFPEDEHEWAVHHQFQSHEPEFDYLKSLEIEEKINFIEWCRPRSNQLSLLTTNGKSHLFLLSRRTDCYAFR
jgi:hypothetical protein